MTGTLISEMTQLTQLSTLDLSNNLLHEPVFPTVLTQMVALEELILDNVGMGGTLPDAIGNLTNLQFLIIPNNSFQWNSPRCHEARLTNLYVGDFCLPTFFRAVSLTLR